MQTILAIETSQAGCSVALRTEQGIAERAQLAERKHATVLLPLIESLLGDCSLSPQALDCVVFGRGPGSFTGARIAASVAQGLAYGSGCGVVAVSSLQALAHTAVMELNIARDDAIFVAIDAHMEELYCACYRNDAEMKTIQEDGLLDKPGCTERLKAAMSQERTVHLLGSGLGVLSEYIDHADSEHKELASIIKRTPTELLSLQPSARSVLQLAELSLQRGEPLAPEQAVPAYLRGSSAWKKITDG